jgi:hypothetical protein
VSMFEFCTKSRCVQNSDLIDNLSKLVLFGEGSLRRAVGEYVRHSLEERNHQGKGNVLLFPRNGEIIGSRKGRVLQRETGRSPEVLPPRGRMSI